MRVCRSATPQLSLIRGFVYTCHKKEALLKLLGSRIYMLDDTFGQITEE